MPRATSLNVTDTNSEQQNAQDTGDEYRELAKGDPRGWVTRVSAAGLDVTDLFFCIYRMVTFLI